MRTDSTVQAILADQGLTNREKLAYIDRVMAIEAAEDFYAFRRFMYPKQKTGWFQQDVARQLQQFYQDLLAGKRPKLVIEAPPQHGKSIQIVDFIAWLSAKHPQFRTIYGSFSDRLGIRANLALQRIWSSPRFQMVFPAFKIPGAIGAPKTDKQRNRNLIEYIGEDAGYFRNTTVEGSVTGESLDLGVIDDPIKSRKEANSKTRRDAAWDWLTDDFFTRFSEDAGLLCILTRWHVDDPIGRLIESDPAVKVCKYKAIATEDEEFRRIGEPLFAELKSLEFLLERKRILAAANWEALYQQSPYIAGGGIIKGDWFGRYDSLPRLKYRACFGDTAVKAKESNDYQVAGAFGLGMDDGRLYVMDIDRDRYEAVDLEIRFPDFWHKHKAKPVKPNGPLRYFGIEDKASGSELIQRMRKRIQPKIPVRAIPRSTDKYSRVSDVLSYIESGYVVLPNGAPWVKDFIAECEAFTADDAHDNDDQIDVLCDAISNMLNQSRATAKDIL